MNSCSPPWKNRNDMMRFDFLGNSLDRSVEDILRRRSHWEPGYGSAINDNSFTLPGTNAT